MKATYTTTDYISCYDFLTTTVGCSDVTFGCVQRNYCHFVSLDRTFIKFVSKIQAMRSSMTQSELIPSSCDRT